VVAEVVVVSSAAKAWLVLAVVLVAVNVVSWWGVVEDRPFVWGAGSVVTWVCLAGMLVLAGEIKRHP
jgi:hypothetical protein